MNYKLNLRVINLLRVTKYATALAGIHAEGRTQIFEISGGGTYHFGKNAMFRGDLKVWRKL